VHSSAGGHHYLSKNTSFPANNSAILNVAEIIKAIMSSAAEAKLGALYINDKKAVKECIILEEMGHPQPPTPVHTDNCTADAIVNSHMQPKHTKTMDMSFYWLCDRTFSQQQFHFFWHPGTLNYADYWTKHHPAPHHRKMRSEFLTPFTDLLQLCATSRSPARVC
jgi:hypothetical protein